MGALFGSDSRDGGANFFVDFENAQPTPGEKNIFDQVQVIVGAHTKIVSQMAGYKGCTELIQKAISQPTDENKKICSESLIPSVEVLKEFYLHAEGLAKVFPLLLEALCSPIDAEQAFTTQQALTKQLAGVFDFCMCFDELKMSNPAISNDFSYYRRSMSALRMQGGGDNKTGVTDELANKMSLFYAFPTPMLNLVKNCIQSDKLKIDKERILSGLSLVANVCYSLVGKKKFNSGKILMFCLRAAVGATILVDSLFDPGVFHPKAKKAPISAKNALFILKNFTDPDYSTTNLINALKYNTKDADPTLFD